MPRIIARLVSHAPLLLVGLLIVGTVATVHAQNIAVSKDLCGPPPAACVSQSTSPSVPPNTPVSYPITLYNPNATSLNVDLQETFQPGFHFTGSTCGPANPPFPPAGVSTFLGPLALPPMTTTTCIIYGWFEYLPASQNNASNTVTVYASADAQHQIALGSSTINATVDGAAPIPTDVSVTKTAAITSTDPNTGALTVHYTIMITNNGPNDINGFLLQDRLSVPATGVPLIATYSGGSGVCAIVPPGASTCFNPVPSIINSPATVSSTNPTDFAQWSYPAGTTGLLRAYDSMVIEFDVTISTPPGLNCVRNPIGNSLFNEAHISFSVPGSTTTIQDLNPSNNTATGSVPITIDAPVDPTCGAAALEVTKTQDTLQPPGGFPWGSTINYTITLTNNSTTQTIGNIQLFDAINGSLGDLVQGGVGTPPFIAELVSWTCLSSICTNSQAPPGNTQQVTGYGDTKWMFGTTVYAPPNMTDLAPLASVSFQLQIRYSNPGCDSYTDLTLKPVINFVRASYQDTALGTVVVQSLPVTAHMQAPQACQFLVQKSVDSGLSKITFSPPPAPVSYTVTFANPTSQSSTIGTLIDTLRIAQSGYATQLPVTFSYTCAPSPFGSVTGFPASGSGSLTVNYTSLPQQGVRIIQNAGPVTFQPQSTLTCTVTITVGRPSEGDPNCAREGRLENTAIMDTSAFYNSNLPWPPGTNPGYFAAVSRPLPQCLNLVVNKFVNPIWATQNGGPLNYALTITNFGDPIAAADGITLSDAFTPASYAASSWTTICNPPTSSCTPTWSPNPTSNPSTLHITALDQNQAIVTNFAVNGPFPAPPGPICNHAGAAVVSLPAGDWYAKNPLTWQTDLCVPIFDARPLDITKTVTVTPPATTPPVTPFAVNVVCSFIQNGVQYGPSATVTFSYPSNLGPLTVPNIPVGSTCTITEQQPLPPPVAMTSCPSGLGAWGPVTYPNPVGPDATPQSVTIIITAPNRLEVRNTFACVPVGMLSVTKTFDPSSPASQFPATAIFPVLVACTGRSPTIVNLTSPSFQQIVPNIPMGSMCTIAELTPIGTDVQPNCHWDTSYPSGQSVTIPNGSANLEVRNTLRCTGTLTVYKTFEPSSLAALMPTTASFPIQIVCTPGSTTTFNLSSGNQFQFQTPSMPTGTVCTITELTPLTTSPPPDCLWATPTYPKGQSVTIPNGTSSLIVQNTVTCTSPVCDEPPSGMVGWWPLDETPGMTTVQDISGLGNNGTPQPGSIGPLGNGPFAGASLSFITPPAKVDGSLYFAVPSRFVQVPDAPSLNFGEGDFTIDAWVYHFGGGPNNVSPIADKLELVSTPSGGIGYRLFIFKGWLHFVLVDVQTVVTVQAPITIMFGQWHHVAVVRKGGTPANTVEVYIDGQLVSTSTPAVGSVSNNANLLIGGIANSEAGLGRLPSSLNYSEIAIDEVEIFNRALLAEEIQSIFYAGSAGKCKPKSLGSGLTKYTIGNRGGVSLSSAGTGNSVTAGYGRIQPDAGSNTPAGMAIFGYRQGGVLISEAAVSASQPIQSGRIYAEENGPIATGIAIANPNPVAANISFYFSNSSGDLRSGMTTIPANSQVAKFLDEVPFSCPASFQGTFSFTSDVPVGVIALRGFANERSEFLMTTLPVVNLLVAPKTGALLLPHFAAGNGWTTEILLVNSSDNIMTGNVQFTNAIGGASNVTIGGQTNSRFAYSIPRRASQKLTTDGSASTTVSGAVRIIPGGSEPAPTSLLVFSYKSAGITIAASGVTAVSGTAFRMYAESSGEPGRVGNIQTGIAVANGTAAPATITFELTWLNGSTVGLTGSLTLPASGQTAKFLSELFPTLPNPFQGVVRIASSSNIAVVGVRGRYNERQDFLIATTEPVNETLPAPGIEMVLPHVVDSGGYTTQFILFSGSDGPPFGGTLRGTLRLVSQLGEPLDLGLPDKIASADYNGNAATGWAVANAKCGITLWSSTGLVTACFSVRGIRLPVLVPAEAAAR